MRESSRSRRFCSVGLAALVAAAASGIASAADDFNPPGWVDSDNNNKRDNRDAHFLEPGESLVIGVNPDWTPPANSTSYHWHWWPTDGLVFNGDPLYEEYDSYKSDTWYLPDHQQNFWYEPSPGDWAELKPPPMPRHWGDFDPASLLADPRWEGTVEGNAIPAGAPRGKVTNGVHGGVVWGRADTSKPYGGVFEVPLHADLDLPTTLVRLQYGGGYGPFGDQQYWTTTLEGFDDGQLVPVTRTFRSDIDGTIYYEDWEFEGSPDWMRLTIDFTGTGPVDQVLIDTIAIPEPTTLGTGIMFALAGLGLRRRRS